MLSSVRRRRLLQCVAVGATTTLAGCNGVLGGDDSEPDASTDSYGIELRNEMEQAFTVTIEARLLVEDEQVFSETAEVQPGEQKEWEEVMTEDQTQYRVEATLENADFYDQRQQNRATVSVGTSVSPDVENVVVKVAPYFDLQTVWVNATRDERR